MSTNFLLSLSWFNRWRICVENAKKYRHEQSLYGRAACIAQMEYVIHHALENWKD